MSSRYSDPLPRTVRARATKPTAILGLGAVALAGIAMLTACGAPSALETQARAAAVPQTIASQIVDMDFREETLSIPLAVQDPGTVMVLWRDDSFGGRDGFEAQAVVYNIKSDGTLEAVRTCPLEGADIQYTSGGKVRTSHTPLTNSIDEDTTMVHCETPEEAQAAGHANPMVIIRGRSHDVVPIFGSENGEAVTTGWGVL